MNTQTLESRQNRNARITLSTIRIITGMIFLVAGAAKLIGAEQMVIVFEQIGLGQWLRYLTGAIEFGAALLIFLPLTATIGAMALAATMVGAVFAQWAAIGGSAVPALVLLLLAATIAWIYWPKSILRHVYTSNA